MSRAISSTNVLLDGESELHPATIIFSTISGSILYVHNSILESNDPIFSHYGIYESNYRNFGDLYILPGVIDTHVHLNEPGRSEWEGFETGTKSAASGGITTVIEMPLNSIPPTTTLNALYKKIEASRGKCWTDVGFWGGIVPGNEDDIIPLINAGVRGFKSFLSESGVNEFPSIRIKDYEKKVIPKIKNEKTLLMFHSEMAPIIDIGPLIPNPKETPGNNPPDEHKDPKQYKTYLESRPDAFETRAVDQIIELSKRNPTIPLHIVHLSSQQCLYHLIKAQTLNLPITVETCFHYLSIESENIPDGCTHYKCTPPIRGEYNQFNLWLALKFKTITSVVSDHSPCTIDLKRFDTMSFFDAWGGITSVGYGLSIMWTKVLEKNESSQRRSHMTIAEISTWLSYNTAKQAGLLYCKGSIKVGKCADFAIFDQNMKWTVRNEESFFKNKLTPYHLRQLTGRVVECIVGGHTSYVLGKGHSQIPFGKLILEKRFE